MCVSVDIQEDGVVDAVLMPTYKITDHTDKIHSTGLKRMGAVVDVYSLETDFGR